jgi:crotonobetainyl-CoA:carnitine CoA-transferase CaiB-like acyl-CoA transferase
MRIQHPSGISPDRADADDPNARGALAGVRVVDLTTGTAGPMATALLADFGADVVRVESPGGDPMRSRATHALWNRNKRGCVLDLEAPSGPALLGALIAGADVCVANGTSPPFAGLDPSTVTGLNPGLVYLNMPPYMDQTPWAGGAESSGLLSAYCSLSLRQNSSAGTPVDPAFPYVLYLQGIWAAACCVAALVERERSGYGQIVTVAGIHGVLIAGSGGLLIDPTVPDKAAAFGAGGPNAMYTRYRCADSEWIFLATLTEKFQRAALDVLGLSGILEDERIGGDLDAFLLPANQVWVRARFEEQFRLRTCDEWLRVFRAADIPAGPVSDRKEYLASDAVTAIGLRQQVRDPTWGPVVMPANSINLVRTPAALRRPAPTPGEHTFEPGQWPARPASASPAPAAQPPAAAGPLHGFRILDLGVVLAGPFAGALLAELGADVIKVEMPAGDSWRARGMPYIRGQRGLAIDLSTSPGRDAFYRLVRAGDVVLDNFRSGVLRRLGADYDRLRQVNPGIISLSITGFGDESPLAAEPAFDPLLQARSGMMSAQGGDGDPVLLTVPVNDVTTAAASVLGTVVALFHRARTGEGQRIWTTLVGSAAMAQSEELLEAAGWEPVRTGGPDYLGPSAVDRAYEAADGWVRIQALEDDAVARLQDRGLLAGDPADDAELARMLEQAIASKARDAVVEQLAAAGIAAVPVRRLSEIAADEDLVSTGILRILDRTPLTPIYAPLRYAFFSRTQNDGLPLPPGVGEHSAEVLREAGLSEPAIAELLSAGVIVQGGHFTYRELPTYR